MGRTIKAQSLGPDGRPGRVEVWEAWHEGWHLERLEERGTPWSLTLVETGETCWQTARSRAEAIEWVDSGVALRMVEAERARSPHPVGAEDPAGSR